MTHWLLTCLICTGRSPIAEQIAASSASESAIAWRSCALHRLARSTFLLYTSRHSCSSSSNILSLSVSVSPTSFQIICIFKVTRKIMKLVHLCTSLGHWDFSFLFRDSWDTWSSYRRDPHVVSICRSCSFWRLVMLKKLHLPQAISHRKTLIYAQNKTIN